MPDSEIELIDKNCLITELRSCNSNSPTKKEIIILDCRSANDYASSHIKHSTNISIPTIMLRRLKEGKVDLFSTIKCKELKSRILGMDVQTLFVLYHNNSAHSSPDIIHILARKLMAEFNDKKIRVVCLTGKMQFSISLSHSSALPKKKKTREKNLLSSIHQQFYIIIVIIIHERNSSNTQSSGKGKRKNISFIKFTLENFLFNARRTSFSIYKKKILMFNTEWGKTGKSLYFDCYKII